MAIICPTITASDMHEYRVQIENIAAFAKRIHIDLMDGKFAPSLSPTPDEIWLPEAILCDIHIMYQDVEKWLPRLIELKPNLVVVHAEIQGMNDLPLFATRLREAGIKTGLALLQDTSVETVRYLLPHMQHALVFSGHLGYHGGEADLKYLEKVKQLKQEHRWLEIAWDGGINDENAKALVEGGVEVLNVGGYIQKSENPEQSFRKIENTLNLTQ